MFDDYMINAWAGATMVAAVAGLVGFFVVLRGASFAAHSLPLCAFPGAAAASVFGVSPLFGLIAFSGLGAAGIAVMSRRGRSDIATALSLVTLLGLGALFLSLTNAYFQTVYALLFGEVLGISSHDLWTVGALGVAVVALLVAAFRPLLLSSLSPELCESRGVSASAMEGLFLGIVALATTMALPVVGALLVFSLMVGPASAARAFTDRPFFAMLFSGALAVVTVWAAIALSFLTDLPIGFFVGTLSALAYAAGRLRSWAPQFAAQRRSSPSR